MVAYCQFCLEGCEADINSFGVEYDGDSNWAFGQVVPVVLLAAPLITVLEYLYIQVRQKRP